MLNIKFAILQTLLLLMLCASMAFMNDTLSGSGGGMIRYIILLLFPVLPWILVSSSLVQYRKRLKEEF